APPNAPASCIEAIAKFNDARRAHLAALAADKAAADARAADRAFVDAVKKYNDHPDVGEDGRQPEIDATAEALDAARDALFDEAERGGSVVLDESQKQRLALLDAAEAALLVADETNADDLGRIADETDAIGLGLARDEALRDAEDACDADLPDDDVDDEEEAERPAFVDLDCDDFKSRAEAQVKLDEDRTDPHNLDEDNDGRACENFDFGDGGVMVEKNKGQNMQVPVQPKKAPQTGGGPAL